MVNPARRSKSRTEPVKPSLKSSGIRISSGKISTKYATGRFSARITRDTLISSAAGSTLRASASDLLGLNLLDLQFTH